MFGDGIQTLSWASGDAGAGHVCGYARSHCLPFLWAFSPSARVPSDDVDFKSFEGSNIAVVSAGPRHLLLPRLSEAGDGHNHRAASLGIRTMRTDLLGR